MKKNININLFDTLYNIDEDAYQLLESYLDNLKQYFSRRDGGEEIADDIEHRIAELLWEKKEQGVECIDIQTIKTILKQIGNPEEISGSDESASSSADERRDENPKDTSSEPTTSPSVKKLYRDTRNKKLGGVLSGVAHYFGSFDPLAWRLAFVVVFFLLLSFSGDLSLLYLVAYIVAWMLIPEARTADERLAMMGKPVNAETIKEETIADQENAQSGSSSQQNAATGCANGCLDVLVTLFKLLAFALLAILGIILFFVLIGVFVASDFFPSSDFLAALTSGWNILRVACICVIIFIPVYALARRLFARTQQSRNVKIMLLVAWIAALAGFWLSTPKVNTYYLFQSLLNDLTFNSDTINWFDPDDPHFTILKNAETSYDGIGPNGERVRVHLRRFHDNLGNEVVQVDTIPYVDGQLDTGEE